MKPIRLFSILIFSFMAQFLTSSASIGAEYGAFTQIQAFNFDFDDNIFVTPAHIMIWDKEHNREVGISPHRRLGPNNSAKFEFLRFLSFSAPSFGA